MKPACYLITGGDSLTVWNYQGGAVPDVKVIEVKRAELRERFHDFYGVLNPEAAAASRDEKVGRLTSR